MTSDHSIGRRLGRAFLLQAALISAAALLGVYAAALTIENLLIRQALEREASYFWERYAEDPTFPVPDTRNMTGYLEQHGDSRRVPAEIRSLAPGFHRLEPSAAISVVYVADNPQGRLYLVFDGERVRELALFFGVLPLALVLVVIYLVSWLGYRLSRRAVSPIVQMADQVKSLDVQSLDPEAFSLSTLTGRLDDEVVVLADALSHLSQRVNELLERERNFTRDASHELRSPLTVIHIATDMLLADKKLDKGTRNAVQRIQRAAKDMEELTEAFLLLARASDAELSREPVCVNDVVEEELQRARLILGDKSLDIEVVMPQRLTVMTSEKVLCVLIGNLIRNAMNYTDEGHVTISIKDDTLTIADSGKGMPAAKAEEFFKPFVRGQRQRGGYGVGLTIVKRLSTRFGWPVTLDSRAGEGTRVTVDFSGA